MTKMSLSCAGLRRRTGPFCLAVGLALSLQGRPEPAPPHTHRVGVAWVANSMMLAGIRGLLATHRARVLMEQSRVAHLFGVCGAPHQ